MELFRVGGDVPDTNYLFMGTNSCKQAVWMANPKQETLLIEDSTLLNHSYSFFASKYDTQIA
jgi:hypothetical protein